jgi:hypothetical protein
MIPTEPGWWWCVRGDTRLRVRPRIVRVVEVENGEPRIDGRLIGARSAQIAWIEPVAPIGALAAAERRAEEAEALLAEVRAELAAERGEAEGALPGWVWTFDDAWYNAAADYYVCRCGDMDGSGRRAWGAFAHSRYGQSRRTWRGAREAMRAVDAAHAMRAAEAAMAEGGGA